LIPFFGERELSGITPFDVRALIDDLDSRGLALATVQKNLAPLKAMFATALEQGEITRNPGAGVYVFLKSGRGRPDARALTRRELARLLLEIPATERSFFQLLAHSGLRISEAIGLRWEDVRLDRRPRLVVRQQHYRGTTRKLKRRASYRTIPLSSPMSSILRTQRPPRSMLTPGENVFVTPTGTPLDEHNLRRRVLAPAARRAGVPWAGFHTFRHTCATLLFRSGKSPAQVAAWLGHRDPLFTQKTYVHLIDSDLGDPSFLDDLF
jgi:integrase